jgi:chemotaxis protein MotB
MDDHPHPEIIIIKRRSNREEEHHGGAWKIAFADFMTAMMAFFLVLWIINATDPKTKRMIAHYFNPVKLEEAARSPKSIRGDEASTVADAPGPNKEGSSGAAGPIDGKTTSGGATDAAKTGALSDSQSVDGHERHGNSALAEVADPTNPKPTMSEGVLFADPYRSLDAIAGPPPPDARAVAQSDSATNPTETAPANPGVLRDPFRPIGHQAATDALTAGAIEPPRTPSAASPPPGERAKPATAAPPPSGPIASEAQQPLAATAVRLQKELELQVGALGTSRLGPAIDVKATDEGLLISLTDRLNFSMFAIGSAEPQRQVVQAMEAVARSLKDRPGIIVVRGHTDGHPYKSTTYDNWRLSSARAQLSYYMLVRAGVPESRFERIEGYADRRLRDPSHPFAAENRRIEILLREPKP